MKRSTNKKSNKKNLSDHRAKLFIQVLRYLKDDSCDEEMQGLQQEIEDIFRRGDQDTIDFISQSLNNQEFEEQYEEWLHLLDSFCSYQDQLLNSKKEKLKAIMLLIPVVVSVASERDDADDSFELVKMGVLRDLMIQSGLISDEGENLGTLNNLFSLEEIRAISQTMRHELLKVFTGDKLAQNPIFKNILQPSPLVPGSVNIKLKFIIGVATLKESGNISPLSRLLDPDEFYEDEQMDKDVMVLEAFSNVLSEKLPSLLKEKSGVAITTHITSIERYTFEGLRFSINGFEEFKVSLLFEKSALLENPKVKISKVKDQPLEFVLFDKDLEIFNVSVNLFYDSLDDIKDYLDEIVRDLEFREFYCESQTEDGVIFVKKPMKGYGKSRGGHLRLLN
ncbi:MAG: hypothetical protein ABIQ95_15090 [Bdellovibrionia bacterium]